MVLRFLLVWRVVGRVTGRWFAPAALGVLLLTLRALTTVGMLLDAVLFPRLRSVGTLRPIVVAGNPRTGTTLMQRFLVEHGVGHGLQVWRMIHASLTQQLLLRPFLPLMKFLDPTRHHVRAAHETSLTHVDVDDVALLVRYLDGFFLYGFFLAFDEVDHRDRVDPSLHDTSARDLRWLECLWRRCLVWHGDLAGRNVAKLFSFGPRLPALLARFPEARVLYLVRDPVSAIPSAMSLVTGVLDGLLGFWALPVSVRTRYLDRLYRGLVELARRFQEDWESGRIDRARVMVVRYDRLMTDFAGVMTDVLTFVGHEPCPDLLDAIARQGTAQRDYRSGHNYDLTRFGLTEERIQGDLAGWRRSFLTD